MSGHDDTREARLVRALTADFEQERAARPDDERALEGAVASVLRARAPGRLRESGERWMVRDAPRPDEMRGDEVRADAVRPDAARDLREPRVAAAVQTPGPQPAIQVIRRPAPPLPPISRFAVAAAAILGVALGAGAVAGGGVVIASLERERAIAEEVEREGELAGTIAPAPATLSIEVTPTPREAPLAAARGLLAGTGSSHRASRWLVTARDALDEHDVELAERVLRSVVRRWPRAEEAGTARLALAEIYAATDRPREAADELARWLRWNRRADRAPAIESRIVALHERY